ncbi:DUF5317 domain-containing protein [Frankia sp. CNm7]|uniref:DUF5317 domain-containing protein n=1 Tax=Frankia nepalensis TaxID=1836974 RepID=A0A937RQM3_9ACTN|nr:DUF5317 domain-containing protein [Frankia nepalensis]MBL7500738.1 DUF5317 domain-containing protein [Frankia nepalensis]MBL7513196.1 DUF5317 domain-containing protein [Frankia nepalensis]MBL7518703.1 DUF5317 domain-containing protein [Frankia nepalensis]MBL7633190.1 DUF5317 domain-containing protein [Frankia nepalensis]
MFVLLVLALLVGLLVARIRGGTLDALGRVRVRLPWLAAGIVAALLVAAVVQDLRTAGWIAATVLAAALSAANRRIPGLFLMFVGLALNAVVIGANDGRMPVSTAAVSSAGLDQSHTTDSGHVAAGSDTRLRPLGDVIPFPFWVAPAVLSVGDVLIASGVGLFAALAPVRASRTLRARRAQRYRRRQRRLDATPDDLDDQGGPGERDDPGAAPGAPRRRAVAALPAGNGAAAPTEAGAGVTTTAQRGTMTAGADDEPGRRSRHGEEEA